MSVWQPVTDAPDAGAAATTQTASQGDGAPAGNWSELAGMDASLADESMAAPARTRRIGEGVVLLLVVLLVAGAALWLMRSSGAVDVSTQMSSVELKIERALAQLTGKSRPVDSEDPDELGSWLGDSDRLIARFSNDGTDKQVPLNRLASNPFAIKRTQPADGGPTKVQVDPEVVRRQKRMRALRTELRALKLQTVMSGRNPMAVISGQVVREGAKLGSFTVATIEPRTAILTAEGNTYRLSMHQPSVGRAEAHD
jgi:hypothetical protein